MWLERAILAALMVAVVASGASAQGRTPNFPPGVAIPDSTDRNNCFWLGADAPFGTELAPDVSFWVFGDTFLSTPGVGGRQLSSVASNTIAIGQIHGGRFVPRYFYKGDLAHKVGFFPNPDPLHHYWPKAPRMIRGKLYVFLSVVYINPNPPADDPIGAQDTGSVIARVNNPLDIPLAWKVDYFTVHLEGPILQANLKLGIETIPADDGTDSLIVYGFFNNAKTGAAKPVVLLVSHSGLADTPAGGQLPASQVQYLSADAQNANPRWKAGFGPFDAPSDDYFNTQLDAVSGFTVRWNATLGRWQAVGANSQYAALHRYPANSAYDPIPFAQIFTHPTPFGPFQNPPLGSTSRFYSFQELNSPDKTLWIYTARQWRDPKDPRSSDDANILLTYTYSTRDLAKQVVDANYYQTHTILLRNPYFPAPATKDPTKPPVPPTPGPAKAASARPFDAPGAPQPLPFPPR